MRYEVLGDTMPAVEVVFDVAALPKKLSRLLNPETGWITAGAMARRTH